MKTNPCIKKYPSPSYHREDGFTLIELLLSISLSGAILLAIAIVISFVLESGVKNNAIAEVEQQGAYVIQMLTQSARNAQAVNAPSEGANADALSLDVADASADPTIFRIQNEAIQMTEGAGSDIPLTSPRIKASNLLFQNLSRTGTAGTIRIQFTLTNINPSLRNEYTYEKMFFASASLRAK